jgi:hypothetical protein
MLELIEQSRMAVDELIDVMGRASIEAMLDCRRGWWPDHRSKAKRGMGTSAGMELNEGAVYLKERQLRVNKPRLRRKGRGAGKKVPVPV